MDGLGYYMSSRSFKGPFLSDAEVRGNKPVTLSSITLFCVKKELRDAVTAVTGSRRGLLASSSGDGWADWLESVGSRSRP